MSRQSITAWQIGGPIDRVVDTRRARLRARIGVAVPPDGIDAVRGAAAPPVPPPTARAPADAVAARPGLAGGALVAAGAAVEGARDVDTAPVAVHQAPATAAGATDARRAAGAHGAAGSAVVRVRSSSDLVRHLVPVVRGAPAPRPCRASRRPPRRRAIRPRRRRRRLPRRHRRRPSRRRPRLRPPCRPCWPTPQRRLRRRLPRPRCRPRQSHRLRGRRSRHPPRSQRPRRRPCHRLCRRRCSWAPDHRCRGCSRRPIRSGAPPPPSRR